MGPLPQPCLGVRSQPPLWTKPGAKVVKENKASLSSFLQISTEPMFLFIRKVTVKGNFETTITTLTQNFSFPSSFSSHVHVSRLIRTSDFPLNMHDISSHHVNGRRTLHQASLSLTICDFSIHHYFKRHFTLMSP